MYHYAKANHGPRPCFDGIRTGRTETTPPGEVIVSTLSAAELAEFNRRVPPVQAARRPIETDGERLLRKQQKEGTALAQHTQEEYLQLRAEGKTRAQIAAEWGMKEKSLVGNWYPKWGLRKEDEALQEVPPAVQQTPDTVQETVEAVQDTQDTVQEQTDDWPFLRRFGVLGDFVYEWRQTTHSWHVEIPHVEYKEYASSQLLTRFSGYGPTKAEATADYAKQAIRFGWAVQDAYGADRRVFRWNGDSWVLDHVTRPAAGSESAHNIATAVSGEDQHTAPQATVSLPIDCPRCGTRHFVHLRILSNPLASDRQMWWGTCTNSGEPILAGVEVQLV